MNETLDALEAYRFNDAASTLYQFVWHELCDWYIELSKEALYGEDASRKRGAQAVLVHCLETSLRLLHPMMPFVTEQLWQTLKAQVKGQGPDSIMIAPYPGRGEVDEAAERSFGPVLGIIDAIRNIRGEMNIPFKTVLAGVEIGSLDPAALDTVANEAGRIRRLANVEIGQIHAGGQRPHRGRGSAAAVGSGFEVAVPLAGAVDMAAETARIAKEIARVEADLDGVEKRLANPSFVEKAPAEVVDEARARVEELRGRRSKLEAHRDLLVGPEGEEAEPTPAPAPQVDLARELREEVRRAQASGEADALHAERAAETLKQAAPARAEPAEALGPAYMEMGLVEGREAPGSHAAPVPAAPTPEAPGKRPARRGAKAKPAGKAKRPARRTAKAASRKAKGAVRKPAPRRKAPGRKVRGPRRPGRR